MNYMMSFWYVLHVILLADSNWDTVPSQCTLNQVAYGFAVLLVSESMIPTMYTVANADANYMPETGTMASNL